MIKTIITNKSQCISVLDPVNAQYIYKLLVHVNLQEILQKFRNWKISRITNPIMRKKNYIQNLIALT